MATPPMEPLSVCKISASAPAVSPTFAMFSIMVTVAAGKSMLPWRMSWFSPATGSVSAFVSIRVAFGKVGAHLRREIGGDIRESSRYEPCNLLVAQNERFGRENVLLREKRCGLNLLGVRLNLGERDCGTGVLEYLHDLRGGFVPCLGGRYRVAYGALNCQKSDTGDRSKTAHMLRRNLWLLLRPKPRWWHSLPR